MEVIGAVSSVVALVETTSKLAKGLTHLAQRWHNAPEEIKALALATQELCIKFAYVQETVTDSPTTLVDNVTRRGLTQLVSKAHSVIEDLSTLHAKLETYETIIQKAKWAVKDAKTANTALAKVKDVERELSMWISFISLKGHSLTLRQSRETQQLLSVGFTEMKQVLSTLAITASPLGLPLSSIGPTSPPLSPGSAASALTSTARNHSTTAARRIAGGVAWQASSTWESWGFACKVVKSTKGRCTDYDVVISLQLPLAWWFGHHILRGEVAVSFPGQNTLTLRHPSYFAVARVLSYTHPFFEACKSNNIVVVREMLRNGEGRPADEDPDGDGALYYAVEHNSVEVLAELLENGASIDAYLMGAQMTLLEAAAFHSRLDVLRMLLQRGASTECRDEHGFDVYFWCWVSPDHFNNGASAIETANVLSEYVVLDPQCTYQNVAIIHAVAMSGDGHVIDALVSCGHDVEAKDGEGSTPVAYAVKYGNAAAYFALLAHGADTTFSSSSVERMLHRAVALQAQMPGSTFLPFPRNADYEPIIKHILQHGSPNLNIPIRVQPGAVDYLPSVRGHRTTPRQLAEAHGPKTEAWFLTLLLQTGHPHYFTKKDKRRLHALRLEGHAPQGCVLGDDDDLSEDEQSDQSEDWTDDDNDDDDGDDDDHDSDDESDASSTHEETSDEGEEEQFWDAEQDL